MNNRTFDMHALDIRTLFTSYTAIVLMCVLAYTVLWRQNRTRFPSTSDWLLSFCLQFLALILVLLRGVIPDFLSIVGNSVAAITAILMLRKGLEKFFAQTVGRRSDYPLVAIFLGVQVFYTYITPSLAVRNANYAVFLMIGFAQCAVVAMRGMEVGMQSSIRFVTAVMLAGALLHATRLVGIFFITTGDTFFLPNALDAAVFLTYGVLMVAITFSLLMLINQRLRLDLQRDLERLRESEAALRRSEGQLKHAESIGKTGHWALNLATGEMTGSEQAAAIYGLASLNPDYSAIRNARLNEYGAALDQALSDLISSGKPYNLEFKIRAANTGDIRDVQSLASYDQVTHTVFGIVRDITEQKSAERRLHEKESIFRMAVETSPAGFWITDAQGHLLDVNAAYTDMSGYSRDDLLSMHISKLEATESSEQTRHRIESVIRDGHATFETMHQRKDGSHWPVEVVTSYSPAFGGRFFVFLRDITEKRSIEELNWHHANFDRLTDLPNRALLFDRLSSACAQARRDKKLVAVLFMDLDGFKSVNDRFGHEAGDAVLIEASRRWSACVRASDTVARIGGDEFAVVLGSLEHTEDAATLAQKAIAEMQRAVDLSDGNNCHVGTSIGIALYPTDAVEMDTLLTMADEAMYKSKHRGKNTFTFASTVVKPVTSDGAWVPFTTDDELGVGLIDRQHRHLVEMLNQINVAINTSEPQADPNTMFSDLVDYTVMHFESELELMQRYDYPDLIRHDREHARLVQEIKAMVARFEDGAQLATLQILKDWLVGHIHISDRQLTRYLISHGCHE